MSKFSRKNNLLALRYSGLAMLSGIIGMLGIFALLGFSLYNEYQDATTHAQVEVDNFSQVISQEVLSIFNTSDLLLRETQRNLRPLDMREDHIDKNSRKQALHALMKSQIESVPEVEVLNVINAKGDYIYSSLDLVPNINVTDRGYFKTQKDTPTAGLVISPPLISHRTGKWTIILSRRLNFEDGKFAGIVTSVLNLSYFEQFFRTLDLGTKGVVTLFDKDFRLAARFPLLEGSLGKITNLLVKQYVEKGITHAVFHNKSPLDGIERMHSFRQVGDFGFIVFASLADDDYLAEWHQHVVKYTVGAILFSLIVLGFGLLQNRTERSLLSSEETLLNILNISPIAVRIAKKNGRELIFFNRSYAELHKKTPETGDDPRENYVHSADYDEILAELASGNSILNRQVEIKTHGGTNVWALASFIPMKYQGEDAVLGWLSDISHIKMHEAELSRVAHYDLLTGIPNRALLADRMKQAIAQTSREQNMMAVCYLDLDGFKPINDTFGHETGDQILIEVASRIEQTIRGGDTVARLGGDEFVVLLLALEQNEECVKTLERLLAAIAQPIFVKGKHAKVSASIGASIYPLLDADPDTLLRSADQAMYIAKQAGKNRFHIYDPAMDRRIRDQNEFLKSIRYALEHDQFELHYQPKINLRTQKLVGVEALIRWRHPEHGLLSPSAFLRHIENTDLDIKIGEWVTDTALAQMCRWRGAGLDIEVSINISGYHMESSGFVVKLEQQLNQYPDLQHGKLQIEVLETVALNDITLVREIIDKCKKLGVSFALDDFGTGYSSLTYLSNLPIDVLKIDQSFVRDMMEDQGDKAIVQGIITLARAFNRLTIAEGIETKEHYQLLLDMGCEFGQGYFMARPLPAGEMINWQANFCL